jgi:hypothetical protein
MTADEITASVKRKLNITWSDDTTDSRVADVLSKSEATMRRLCDCPEDVTTWDDEDIGLLLDACLYEFSNAADDFRVNYADAIQSCRLKHEVSDDTSVSDDA